MKTRFGVWKSNYQMENLKDGEFYNMRDGKTYIKRKGKFILAEFELTMRGKKQCQ